MHDLLLTLFLSTFLLAAPRDVCDFGSPRRRNCLEFIRNEYGKFGVSEFSRIGLTTNVCFAFSSEDLLNLSNRVNTIAPNYSLAETLSFGCLYHIATANSANFNLVLGPVVHDQGRLEQFLNKHAAEFCKHKIVFRGTYLEGILYKNCNLDPI